MLDSILSLLLRESVGVTAKLSLGRPSTPGAPNVVLMAAWNSTVHAVVSSTNQVNGAPGRLLRGAHSCYKNTRERLSAGFE